MAFNSKEIMTNLPSSDDIYAEKRAVKTIKCIEKYFES